MIFGEPRLTEGDQQVLGLIDQQRSRLKLFTQQSPRRWLGSLRRSTFARAIQGSNSIEGYNATIDEAIAAVENEPPLDERTETWLAIKGYRDALTYIMQAAQDPYFEFSKQFLKSLHFMMIGHELTKYPGQWRPGVVFVARQETGETVYEAPDVEMVDALVQELVDYLKAASNSHSIVRAAMAHLNLTMIHPFKDGNGRMARALQTMVLARDGILHPVFSSIEEWLGRNTVAYYAILAEVGKGKWNPRADALPWVQFCLRAHFQQAAVLIRRNEEYGALFDGVERIIAREVMPDRMALPLFDAALGRRLTNARYQTDAEATQHVAARDLRKLSDLGLLVPIGEKRGRSYVAGPELKQLRDKVRIVRPLEDPYVALKGKASDQQRDLPL
ncbi:MAG: Fic family protein [Kiloniellales bacterium]